MQLEGATPFCCICQVRGYLDVFLIAVEREHARWIHGTLDWDGPQKADHFHRSSCMFRIEHHTLLQILRFGDDVLELAVDALESE